MEHPHEPIDAIKEWQTWFNANSYDPIKKTTESFGDTIVEAATELTPDQIYECLITALQDNYDHCKKEHDNAKALLDLIKKDVSVQ